MPVSETDEIDSTCTPMNLIKFEFSRLWSAHGHSLTLPHVGAGARVARALHRLAPLAAAGVGVVSERHASHAREVGLRGGDAALKTGLDEENAIFLDIIAR